MSNRPLAAIAVAEQIVTAPPPRRTEAQEWGPCGRPPQMHRWSKWESADLGAFTMRTRHCVDCGYHVGLVW